MTIDEAIKNREDCLQYLEGIGQKASPDCVEAVRWSIKALKALRPISREQVEKVWKGEWKPIERLWKYSHQWQCSRCGQPTLTDQKQFCDSCGAPMTDEAVQMVIERMEELKNES